MNQFDFLCTLIYAGHKVPCYHIKLAQERGDQPAKPAASKQLPWANIHFSWNPNDPLVREAIRQHPWPGIYPIWSPNDPIVRETIRQHPWPGIYPIWRPTPDNPSELPAKPLAPENPPAPPAAERQPVPNQPQAENGQLPAAERQPALNQPGQPGQPEAAEQQPAPNRPAKPENNKQNIQNAPAFVPLVASAFQDQEMPAQQYTRTEGLSPYNVSPTTAGGEDVYQFQNMSFRQRPVIVQSPFVRGLPAISGAEPAASPVPKWKIRREIARERYRQENEAKRLAEEMGESENVEQ